MWNILIVIVVAAIIWAFNPLLHDTLKPATSVDQKTQTHVNQVEDAAIQQVNQAREIQRQEASTVEE